MSTCPWSGFPAGDRSLESRFHLRTRESVSIDRDISVPANDDSAEFERLPLPFQPIYERSHDWFGHECRCEHLETHRAARDEWKYKQFNRDEWSFNVSLGSAAPFFPSFFFFFSFFFCECLVDNVGVVVAKSVVGDWKGGLGLRGRMRFWMESGKIGSWKIFIVVYLCVGVIRAFGKSGISVSFDEK